MKLLQRLQSAFIGILIGCMFCIPVTTILSWVLTSGPSLELPTLPTEIVWGPILPGLYMGVAIGALVGIAAPFNINPGKFTESIGGPALLISGIFTFVSHLNLILESRLEKIIVSYLLFLALVCCLFLINNLIGKQLEFFRYKRIVETGEIL